MKSFTNSAPLLVPKASLPLTFHMNHPDIYDTTPIFLAVRTAYSKAADVLMEYSTDLDVIDVDGPTVQE